MGFSTHENKSCCRHAGPEEHAHSLFSYFIWGYHVFIACCTSPRDTHACKHLETPANPSQTLPLHVCSVVDWIESVLQRSMLLLGAHLSDAACEGRRIQTGSLRTWRAKSERRGCTAVTLSSSVTWWLRVRRATYQIGGEGEVEVRASVNVGEDAPGRRNMGVSGVY